MLKNLHDLYSRIPSLMRGIKNEGSRKRRTVTICLKTVATSSDDAFPIPYLRFSDVADTLPTISFVSIRPIMQPSLRRRNGRNRYCCL